MVASLLKYFNVEALSYDAEMQGCVAVEVYYFGSMTDNPNLPEVEP